MLKFESCELILDMLTRISVVKSSRILVRAKLGALNLVLVSCFEKLFLSEFEFYDEIVVISGHGALALGKLLLDVAQLLLGIP
jgi:hypothetical protein